MRVISVTRILKIEKFTKRNSQALLKTSVFVSPTRLLSGFYCFIINVMKKFFLFTCFTFFIFDLSESKTALRRDFKLFME